MPSSLFQMASLLRTDNRLMFRPIVDTGFIVPQYVFGVQSRLGGMLVQ